MIVKKSKAQIMILDVLIFIIVVLLVIIIQTNLIINYQNNIKFTENKINFLKNDYLIDLYILDCNYWGKYDVQTNKCLKNTIELKNTNQIPKELCKINLNNKNIINKHQKIIETHTRGVVYNNTFSVLEVSFCEN